MTDNNKSGYTESGNFYTCWNCGTIGEEQKHCIICDRRGADCQCPEPNYWNIMVCPNCKMTW